MGEQLNEQLDEPAETLVSEQINKPVGENIDDDAAGASGEEEPQKGYKFSRDAPLASNIAVAAFAIEVVCLIVGLLVPFIGFILYAVGGFIGGILSFIAWRTLPGVKKPGVVITAAVAAVLLLAMFAFRCVMFAMGITMVVDFLGGVYTDTIAPAIGA